MARHVLIGILAGFGHAILSATARPIAALLDGGSTEFRELLIGNLWDALAAVSESATIAITISTGTIVLIAIFLIVLRRRALAGAALFALSLTYFWLAVGAQRPASMPSYIAIAVLQTFIPLRYGLVALCVMHTTFFALLRAPLLPGAGWATASAPVTLAVVVALALWAFRTSLGGQPMFDTRLLDE